MKDKLREQEMERLKSDARVIIKDVIYENTDGWPGDRENSRVIICLHCFIPYSCFSSTPGPKLRKTVKCVINQVLGTFL